GRLVHRVHRREPHDPRALARRQLDGERVHAADRRVQRDGAHDVHAGDRLAGQRGAAGGVGVVRLDDVPRQAVLPEVPGDLQVGRDARHRVGPAVHVDVVGAADQVAGALRRDRVAHALSSSTSLRRLATVPCVTGEGTPSSASTSSAASISWRRLLACFRVPASSRSTSPGAANISWTCDAIHSPRPAARAASSASTTTAAKPFMNTLRSSFLRAASPGGPSTTSTGVPNALANPANRPAASPETHIGVRTPLPGTGAIRATSTKAAPAGATAAATSRFSCGGAVFSSA